VLGLVVGHTREEIAISSQVCVPPERPTCWLRIWGSGIRISLGAPVISSTCNRTKSARLTIGSAIYGRRFPLRCFYSPRALRFPKPLKSCTIVRHHAHEGEWCCAHHNLPAKCADVPDPVWPGYYDCGSMRAAKHFKIIARWKRAATTDQMSTISKPASARPMRSTDQSPVSNPRRRRPVICADMHSHCFRARKFDHALMR
jgi:hypothetical protein